MKISNRLKSSVSWSKWFANKLSAIGLFVLLTLQVGCGGGSSSSNPPTDPGPTQSDVSIVGPDNQVALVGQVVGLVLFAPNQTITNVSWTQTSGTQVDLLAANSKVISFEVPVAGQYTFQAAYIDSQAINQSLSFTFTATSEAANYLNIRRDHEVNSKAKVSLNAYESFPGTPSNFNWVQLSGPTVSFETNDGGIYFRAPVVSKDTVLQFQVSGSDDQGHTASDQVRVLVEPETISVNRILNAGRFQGLAFADVYAYKRQSPYANQLVQCVYGNTMNQYCSFATLPALGMSNSSPTLAEVMDRVVVSHDWMGARFEAFMTQMDSQNDIKQLLGAATAIVISYDIRPSFFWSGSGAIYIDPNYFWITPEERDTINQEPDFRSNFDQDLQFQDPWRVVLNNDYAWVNYNINSRATRSFDDHKLLTARLMIHELTHANDFLPPRVWSSQASTDYPWTYSSNHDADSTGLDATYPLSSNEMYGLARVMFQGQTADATQAAYSPAQVSDFFFPDNASNTYNYSTSREDYAMLAEEYLMSYRYGVQYDAGITGLPPEYIVSQAERGRIGHARILPRAEYVIQHILPAFDTSTASASIPAPIALSQNVSWWDTLVPPTLVGVGKQKMMSPQQREQHPIQLGRDLHLASDLE